MENRRKNKRNKQGAGLEPSYSGESRIRFLDPESETLWASLVQCDRTCVSVEVGMEEYMNYMIRKRGKCVGEFGEIM